MPLAKPPRDQDLYGTANQFAAIKTEHLLGLGVHQRDPPPGVDDHHGIRSRFQQSSELLVQGLSVADVANSGRYQKPFRRLQRTQADLNRKFLAIVSQSIQL